MELSLYNIGNPETGLCTFNRMITYQELFDGLQNRLKGLPGVDPDSSSLHSELDYFNLSFDLRGGQDVKVMQIPRLVRWVACFVVEGGSEGHYIHVELIYGKDERAQEFSRQLVCLGKTFMGLDHALRVAAECTREFYS